MPHEPTSTVSPKPNWVWLWLSHGVVIACAVLAVWGAIPFAGGFSDGSRLAAIESLGARGTLAVDDSVFIGYQHRDLTHPPAYDPTNPHLVHGPADRMFVQGHFTLTTRRFP